MASLSEKTPLQGSASNTCNTVGKSPIAVIQKGFTWNTLEIAEKALRVEKNPFLLLRVSITNLSSQTTGKPYEGTYNRTKVMLKYVSAHFDNTSQKCFDPDISKLPYT